MKKFNIGLGLVALLAAATSCDKYDIYPEDFDSVFAIRDAGTRNLTVYSTDVISEVPFVVMKGGYDPATVSVATLKTMSDDEFEEYKASSGNTLYAAVGSECYSFSPNDGEQVYAVNFDFNSADKKYDYATLYIRPAKLKTWLDANAADLDGHTPCVPVTLESATDTVSSYNNVTLVCVDLNSPTLALDVEGIVARTVNKKTMGDGQYVPEGNISIPCNNTWGFTVNLKANDQLLADYNAANGTSFRALPEGSYKLNKTLTFAKGTTYSPLGLNIDLNKLTENVQYAIAVKIDDEQPIVWEDPNNNPGDAITIDTDRIVVYTVRVVDAVILKKISLDTSKITSNDCATNEGSIAALFDGDPSTYFHSAWQTANPREQYYASFIEIELPTEMSTFRFDMTTRNPAASSGIPKVVYLYGTNDKNNWPTTPFAKIENMTDQLTGQGVSGSFGTDEEPFRADTDIKYLRFCVMESNSGDLRNTSTAIFWNAAELVLYGNY